MYVVVYENGTRWLRQATPLCVDCVKRMFEWIESEDPRVKKRLFPDTFADPTEEAAWRRLTEADLAHLILSRRQIVDKDLARLRADGPGLYRWPVSKGHDHAWISSLNAARLALFELHDLGPEDMDIDPEDIVDEDRQLAMVQIDILGFIQDLLLQGDGGADVA
ncbi:MAG: DUF2017 family protein [Planctomycetota bacterium]